jgi:hypothetical protein
MHVMQGLVLKSSNSGMEANGAFDGAGRTAPSMRSPRTVPTTMPATRCSKSRLPRRSPPRRR